LATPLCARMRLASFLLLGFAVLVTADEALVQVSATASAATASIPWGPCRTCVWVLERLKLGKGILVRQLCDELYQKLPDYFSLCHQVLDAMMANARNIQYWEEQGCYKYEVYDAREWVKPCPSHVICAEMKTLAQTPFCVALPMENPFGTGPDASGGAKGGAAGGSGGAVSEGGGGAPAKEESAPAKEESGGGGGPPPTTVLAERSSSQSTLKTAASTIGVSEPSSSVAPVSQAATAAATSPTVATTPTRQTSDKPAKSDKSALQPI